MKYRAIIAINSLVLLGCVLGLVYSQSEAGKPMDRNKLYRIEELVKKFQDDPNNRSNVQALKDLAEDENPVVRTNAVSAFGTISSGNQEELQKLIVPFLSGKLGDDVQSVRRAAAKALGSFGVYAQAAVPQLIETARNDYNKDSGWFSVEAIGNVGPDAKEGVPTLIWMLGVSRDNEQVSEMGREYAINALAKMGSAAEDALLSLFELLDVEEEPKTRGLIIQAIFQIDHSRPELEAALTNLYNSDEVWSRYYAVKAIESFESKSLPIFARKILKQAVNDQDEDVRSIAMRLLN